MMRFSLTGFAADRDIPSLLRGGAGIVVGLADGKIARTGPVGGYAEAHAAPHPWPLRTRGRGRRASRVFLTLTLLSLVALPAHAASITSLDFFADARPANAFLVASSRLAATNGARRVAAFARREAVARDKAVADLAAWRAADLRTAEANDLAPSLDRLGRIFGPADRAIAVTRTIDREPVLAHLANLSGRAFDAVYVEAQTAALERLAARDKDFILNGDDEVLRAFAVHDLPRVRVLLAEVRRLR